MNQPLISILVPIYGVEAQLARCVDSLLAQTYEPLEVILVDDASPDGCPQLCDTYAKRDSRVQVIHHEQNRGVSAARNTALVHAAGDYLAFVDPDDYVTPDYVSGLYDVLMAHDADIASCGVTNVLPTGKVFPDLCASVLVMDAHDALRRMCYNDHFYVTLWDKLYKRALFDGIRFPDGKLFEDTGVTYQVVLRARTLVADCRTSRYFYITKPQSITTSAYSPRKMDYVEMADRMAAEVERAYPDLHAACLRKRAHAYFSTLCQMVNARLPETPERKQLIDFLRAHQAEILRDPDCPQRDRLALHALTLGYPAFSLAWRLYCRVKKGSDNA